MTRVSRRTALRWLGGGAALLSAAACGDNVTVRARDAVALVLEPASDGFVMALWARDTTSASVLVTGPGVERAIPVTLDPETVTRLDVRDLAAARTYEVHVYFHESLVLGPHRVRTPPADAADVPVRIAVTADVDPNPAFATDLADHVRAAAPDLLVTIGDLPYADDGPVPFTPEEHRDRYAEVLGAPRVRTLLQAAGVRAIYDDHEVRNDWNADTYVEEPERTAVALAAWDEFFPLATPPGAASPVRYRSWRWGAHCECFLLDTRRFRSANRAPDTAVKTMLGAAQRAWLLAAVQASTATFKLIFTTVPLDFAFGDDAWHVFTTERDAIFAALAGIPGILFLSGDQHWFAAHRHAGGIREIQIGPFARGIVDPSPARPGRLFAAATYNVGLLDIAGDRLAITGLGPGGERFYEETVTAADLTPT